MNILIVEDESLVALDLQETINKFGYKNIQCCSSVNETLKTIENFYPNITIMDINLEDKIDGIELAKVIKKKYSSSIIFLTAYSDTKHIKKAIDIEPLGYLIKPINKQELYALIMLEQKRGTILTLDKNFSINKQNGELTKNNIPIKLTKQEKNLLKLFVNNLNKIISIEKMELELWPYKESNEARRRSLIRRLRTKLENRFLTTIYGEGYIFKINSSLL